MHQKEITNDERLDLIADMITRAKRSYSRGGSFQFLLWGWMTTLAYFGHYCLDKFTYYQYPYIVWLLTIPTLLVSILYGIRQERKAGVSSHLGRIYGHVWMAAGVGSGIVLAFMPKLGYNHSPIILLMAAMATYISGNMLRFKPLIVGAFTLWIASIVSLLLPVMEQTLVGGIAVLTGYLIPGYLLRNAEK